MTGCSVAPLPPLSHVLMLLLLPPPFFWGWVGRRELGFQGWAYYSSGADDEVTMRENRAAYQRIWFRPRCLVNVKSISLETKIMGYPSSFPL